jgi:hypothetical protein
MQKTEASQTMRIPARVLIIVFAVIVLSLVSIMLAIGSMPSDPGADSTEYFPSLVLLLSGAIGVAMSFYALLGIRKRLRRAKIENPAITTTVECKACGFKSVREFQRGDYIFKEGEPCPKCSNKSLITAIYREVKEKEKEFV